MAFYMMLPNGCLLCNKRICILLLLGQMFYKYTTGQVSWPYFSASSSLTDLYQHVLSVADMSANRAHM